MSQAAQTITVQPAPYPGGATIMNTQPRPHVEKHATIFYRLGVVQVILGALSIILGIALIPIVIDQGQGYHYYYDSFGIIGTGIWCGVFFVTSGSLGIASGKNKQYCTVVAAMVMTIFSALAASTLFGLEVPAAAYADYYTGYYENWYPDYQPYNDDFRVNMGLHITLCIIAFTELIISIVHSAYCCSATCCKSTVNQPQYVVTSGYANPMSTTFVQGQPVFYTVGNTQHQAPTVFTNGPMIGVQQQMPQQLPAMNQGWQAAPPYQANQPPNTKVPV